MSCRRRFCGGSGEVCCIPRREEEEPKKGEGRGRKGVLTLPSLPLLAKGRRGGGGLARTEREEKGMCGKEEGKNKNGKDAIPKGLQVQRFTVHVHCTEKGRA